MQRETGAQPAQTGDQTPLVDAAIAALNAGDPAKAAALAREAATRAPDAALAWEILAIALHRTGQLQAAIEAGRRAIALNPNSAEFHANLGVVLRAAGQNADAEAAYRASIALDPKFAAAHANLGNLLRETGRNQEAESAYRAALAAKPNYPDAWHGLGIALHRLMRFRDAEPCLRMAVALAPRADFYADLASAVLALQRPQEAGELFMKAIAIDPNLALAHGNLGAMYLRGGQLVAAERSTLRAAGLAPKEHRWISNLAVIAKDFGRFDEAESLFRHALAMKPDYALGHANLLFCLNYHPTRSAEEIFAEYKAFDAAHARPHMPARPAWTNTPDPARKLKVGYLSPDFREHAARHFLMPLLAHYDRSAIELTCYAEVPNPDAVTLEMRGLADSWRSTVGLSDDEVATLIRNDGIDILVDFGGHTSSSRILAMARKPAPVQIAHHLGHGYTSGLSAIDVYLSDAAMAPQGSEHLFAERVVRLSRIPVAYVPPPGLPEVGPLPALAYGRPVTFGYFGRTERINDRVVAVWSRILQGLPGSRLVLNSKAYSEPAFADYMAGRFAAHGIGRDRLELIYTSPQPATWETYGEIDIALDPWPHNAGTTTIEALWLGVPVVSINDRPSVGRFGASNLGAVGLLDWVAGSEEEYVALALRKAADLDALAALRAGLRARVEASPLADGPGLARELDTVYRKLWQDWCASVKKPADPGLPARRAAAIQAAQKLDAANRLAEAADGLLAYLDGDRADVEGFTYISDIYRRLGRLRESENAARAALNIDKASASASNALGNALAAQFRLTEAEAAFTDAIAAKPGHAEAYNNRALVLMRRGQIVAAERDLRTALKLRPDLVEMGYNLANALQDQGRVADAVEVFRETLAKAPGHSRGHGMMLFALTYHPGLTSEEILAEFRRWNDLHAAKHAPKNPQWANDRTPGRRLRVGYVSPDFANKSSRHFIEPILVGHDRSKVEIFCYAEVPAPDAETFRLKALAEHWRSTVGLSDDELATLIRRDQIDVLVDLGGHTARNRLLTFARKPAPVQVAHFLGHGYTSGMTAMDAFLADEALAPKGSDAYFVEPVIRLPRMPVVYTPPSGMPDVAPLPAENRGYITFGNFGRIVRLNDEVIATWAEIMRAVPRSRLVLNTIAFLDDEVTRRYRDLFASHGITEDRLDLVFTTPQPKAWEAYGDIDIALDPFPHNGGTTTIEAAWLGVPSVCLRMRPSVGCFGATIMGSLGLGDWVTDTREDYVRMAIARANDLTGLAAVRKSLRARMSASPLCDAKGLGHELERVYGELWQKYCDKEARIDALQIAASTAYSAGDWAGAIQNFREALKLSPRAATLSNLGAAHRAAGHYAEAEAAYRDAIVRAPDFAAAHGNLGNLLQSRGRTAEAEVALRRAYELAPHDLHILRNFALCLMRQMRFGEAEPVLRKGIAQFPKDGDLHDNLAQLLRQRGEPVAAHAVYESVAAEIATNWRALGNMALLAQDLGNFDEAESLFRRALALKPDYALAHSNLLFWVNYHPDKTAEEVVAVYREFDAVHARPLLAKAKPHTNDPTPGRRLRVGYLSPDFREHAARHFLEPLLANYNRHEIELTCYAEVTLADATTEKFKAFADHWRSTVGLSDDEVASLIRADKIDILVDFGGHTSGSRILVMAQKPAPIGIEHHLGHGYSSGISAIDVFLSDAEMAPPGSEALFAERVVRLPRIPVAYVPPKAMPAVAPLPALARGGRIKFGYFGRPERMNERVIAAWSEILQRVPESRLVLNSKSYSEQAYRERIAARFGHYGIPAARLELIFTSPQPKTWDAYGDIDIALDPFPHNAGTTTIEALWLGVPVVSVNDRPSVGRFGASNLGALGLKDWLADSVEEYVALAAAKASDIQALAKLREGLRARFMASPLYDGAGLARDMERAYRTLWIEWCRSRAAPPASSAGESLSSALAAFEARDYERALIRAGEATAADRSNAEAWHLKGVAAYRLGRIAEAAADIQFAVALDPKRADFRWNLTPMLRLLGRLEEAAKEGSEAVRLAPNAPEAHNNLATVYKDMGRVGEAETHLRRALALRPNYPDSWSNLAWTLSMMGRSKEAEAAARRALELNPRDANALNNIGTALMQQDRLREASDCFARAVAVKPDFAIAHSNELFCLNYRTDLSSEEIFAGYQRWNEQHAKPLLPKTLSFDLDRDPKRRLRVGYVSPDFRYHAVGFLVESFIAAHDPAEVEVTLYAEVANPDAYTERFKSIAHRWRSTVGLSDAALAEQIRADKIDVLIDLAGHTGGNRLLTFARKPAPVQLSHMVGAGMTTGLTAIDGFLINEALLPEGYERYLSERPIRLSRMPHVYKAPPGMPEVAPLPALRKGHITFGCFSRAARINEDVVAAWARILRSVPGSRLLLNSKPFQEAESRAEWHARFAAKKIDPSRIDLVYTQPQPRTWEAYGEVDIALDPFPHNAGTTTIEALWLGVPVVSIKCRPPVGRFGASLLGSLKLDDWVTSDVDSYVARAVSAASNVSGLASLRASLRDRFKASPLGTDARGLAAEIEREVRKLWIAWCNAQT